MRCIVISTSRPIRSDLEYALAANPGATILRTLDHYPQQYELSRVLEAYNPDVVFVEMNELREEREVLVVIEKLCPDAVIVGVRESATQDFILSAVRLGVREFLVSPITADTVGAIIHRVFDLLGARASVKDCTALLFSFLPAKPGVGTTTIAVNTALAISEQLHGNTLIIDFDQSSGMIGFLLDLQHEYSLSHAVERVGQMDEALWKHIVAKYDKLDVLPTHASRPMNSPSVGELRHLIDFLLHRYKAMLVDMPGTLDPLSLELMRSSTAIFLPCTPEIVSLRLAREKIAFLRQHDLEDRIHILLNRATAKSGIGAKEVWSMLGREVYLEFPNDYAAVSRAAQESGPVESMKPLFQSLASRALGTVPATPKKQLDGLGKVLNSFTSLLRAEKPRKVKV